MRAITGYNNTTVEMRILAPNVILVAATGCKANVRGTLGEIAATVRLEFSAPATAGYAARRLTVDVLRNFILPESPADARAVFLDEIASGAMRWRDLDPYDWTPTVVMVYGRPVEVNLTLFVAGDSDDAYSSSKLGSRNNPWPIYNVWQLQAIAGMSVSMDEWIAERRLHAFRMRWGHALERALSFGGGYRRDADSSSRLEWAQRRRV